METEKVILVNEQDEVTGTAEKMEAHYKGLLHRAFSVFIFNDKGELLLQRRAEDKYHCGGLWTNTCCSHPRPGEKVEDAAQRRLSEEMGLSAPLKKIGQLVYRSDLGDHLYEHEFDHIFRGEYNSEPQINSGEVSDWRWINREELEHELNNYPEKFTPWFKLIIEQFPLIFTCI